MHNDFVLNLGAVRRRESSAHEPWKLDAFSAPRRATSLETLLDPPNRADDGCRRSSCCEPWGLKIVGAILAAIDNRF